MEGTLLRREFFELHDHYDHFGDDRALKQDGQVAEQMITGNRNTVTDPGKPGIILNLREIQGKSCLSYYFS